MHLTLKTEATKPASPNFLQQQARFDAFLERFNHERPHQALGMRVPGELYASSTRPIAVSPTWPIPSTTGRPSSPSAGAFVSCRKVNLSQVFAGQQVGVRQVTDRIWLVTS